MMQPCLINLRVISLVGHCTLWQRIETELVVLLFVVSLLSLLPVLSVLTLLALSGSALSALRW